MMTANTGQILYLRKYDGMAVAAHQGVLPCPTCARDGGGHGGGLVIKGGGREKQDTQTQQQNLEEDRPTLLEEAGRRRGEAEMSEALLASVVCDQTSNPPCTPGTTIYREGVPRPLMPGWWCATLVCRG